MSRNYHIERDTIIRRWYGGYPRTRNSRRRRGPVTPGDCLGIPIPVNLPFMPLGHCMVWKHGLNRDGYGVLTIGRQQELAHRVVFRETRGEIPEGLQVNHLCNRPYCVQPSHLYAGSVQDNRDDSRIFNDPGLIKAPSVMQFPQSGEAKDPLVRRLRQREEYWDVGPWEPVEQPPQLPLEEFTCPKHDFAITMQGGESRICRICEISEFDQERADGDGTWLLVAKICPASQTVDPILEKIGNSEFLGESHLETRRRAYRRECQSFWEGAHNLRNCGCVYCTQDRRTFREAVDPLLTREESDILDICDRMEPQVTGALHDASSDMMDALAREQGMGEEQTRALREHLKDCCNTKENLTSIARTIESDLAYLMYALGRFQDREEILKDPGFEMVMLRWDCVSLRDDGEEDVFRTVLPSADETAERVALAWEREADGLMRPHLETKPELHQGVGFLARLLAKKHIFEHLRYELLGRNSSTEQRPHPHSGCAISIRDTGQVEPFPNDFEEGKGYSHHHV